MREWHRLAIRQARVMPMRISDLHPPVTDLGTVGELIGALRKLPGDAHVWLPDGPYVELELPEPVEVPQAKLFT